MRKDIVLVSNASMDVYPDNKLSDFKVRLPQPLYFDSSYRVAVTRISFTKSFFNYDYGAQEVSLQIMNSDSKKPYQPSPAGAAKSILVATPLPGYYTPESFVDMLNLCLEDLHIHGDDEEVSHPKYSLSNGYLTCDPGKYMTSEGYERRWELSFDPITKAILGMDKDPQRPVFLNQSFTDLYVYSDLVYPTIVGDQTCELLCMLDGQTDMPYGSHCSEVFDDPWYLPLAKNNFQTIHVYLKTDAGKAPRFKFGRVNLRLSFRKENDL